MRRLDILAAAVVLIREITREIARVLRDTHAGRR